jgi:hypothetical protein
MLVKTQLHDNLAAIMAELEPNWAHLFHSFRTSPTYRVWKHLPEQNRHQYITGKLSELHLHDILERATRVLGAQDKVVINPIPDGATCTGYIFQRDPCGQLYAYQNFDDKKTNTAHTEMDLHALIDGIPTLFEIKVRKRLQRENTMLGEKHITHVTDPLKRFYETENVAYAYVAPLDETEPTMFRVRFKKSNGLLIPLYTDCERFNQDVTQNMPLLYQEPKSKPMTFQNPFKDLKIDLV